MVGMLHITPGKAVAFLINKPHSKFRCFKSQAHKLWTGNRNPNKLTNKNNENMSTQRKLARGRT